MKERAALLKDGEWGKLTAEFMEDRTGGRVWGTPSGDMEKVRVFRMLADVWVLHYIRELPQGFEYVCPNSLYQAIVGSSLTRNSLQQKAGNKDG